MAEKAISSTVRSSSYLRWVGLLVLVIVSWILLPPFKVVSLDENGKVPSEKTDDVFDAAAFVDGFWRERLVPHFENATSIESLVSSLVSDPVAAREQFGRQSGDGAIAYYFAKGEGVVSEVQSRRVILNVNGTLIKLAVAPPVFGNTVRDGTALLNVNDFTGLEDFNGVSAILNQKVEKDVLDSLQDPVEVGQRVSFVACCKAPESFGDGSVLDFTPLRLEVTK